MSRKILTGLMTLVAATSAGAQELDKESAEQSIRVLGLITGAMQAEEVPQEGKEQLFACLYGNSLGKINDAVNMAAREASLDLSNDRELFTAIVGVCQPPAAPADTD